jgi:hypothetical protein
MKYAKLTNLSHARRVYSGLRDGAGRTLVLEAGETKPVHPSVVVHPKIKREIDAGVLESVLPGASPAPKKVAPAPPPPADPPADNPPEEKPDAPEEKPDAPEEKPDAQEEKPDAPELRTLFLEAPGITEKNVATVLDTFSSLQELADADEDDLVDAGVSKSFAGRVLEWAVEQL